MKELMEFLGTVEKKCDEITLKLPVLPANIKELLVKIAPYLSIISVVFGTFGILAFLATYLAFMSVIGVLFVYGAAFGTGLFGWLQMVALTVSLICTVRAIPGLFARSRDGWLWLFYGELAIAAGDILGLQFGSLIGVAIGLYFLFQVKGNYQEKKL